MQRYNNDLRYKPVFDVFVSLKVSYFDKKMVYNAYC